MIWGGRLVAGLLAALGLAAAQAASYSLPSGLGSGPFASCSAATQVCSGAVALPSGSHSITLTAPVALRLNSGNFSSDGSVAITNNGHAFSLTLDSGNASFAGSTSGGLSITATAGSVTFSGSASLTGNITASGQISFLAATVFTGDLISTGSTLNLVSGSFTGYCSPSHPLCSGRTVSVATPASLAEGNSGSQNLAFSVSLSSAATQTVTVQYATASGSATGGSDFTATSGTLSFAAGESSKTVLVPVLGDTAVEGDETFTLTLSSPSRASLGTTTATGTIGNDDAAGPTCVTRNPSVCVNDSSNGGHAAWGSASNAQTSNNAWASASVPGTNQTQYLKCTGYGFTVPAGSVLSSIRVGVERRGSVFQDHQVHLVKAGVVQTARNAASTSNWTSADVLEWHGGAPAYWVGTWGATEVNNANFGAAIAADKDPGGPATVQVDHVPIEVCYGAPSGPDHLRIEHPTGNGQSCQAATFTVKACANASCSSLYTAGVSGTLASSNAAFVWPGSANFTIPAGSSSVTVQGQLPVAGTTLLSVASASPNASNSHQCNFGSPSCTFVATTGFELSVPHHRAGTTQTLSLSTACGSALANVTRSITFSCGNLNPSTGSRAVRLSGVALNAANDANAQCASRTVTAAFDGSGVASLPLVYSDAGQVQLSATYTGSAGTGDAGVVISGSTSFVVAPARFSLAFDGAAPRTAGAAFTGSLRAEADDGSLTPNFGRESSPEEPELSHSLVLPTGGDAGSFNGAVASFTGGVAPLTGLIWSEVGEVSVAAALPSGSYLGSGLAVTGSANPGEFRPARLRVSASPACGSFTYAGQPFGLVSVEALSATGGLTRNYDGSPATSPNYARRVRFTEPVSSGKGALDTGLPAPDQDAWPASQFVNGEAQGNLNYRFTQKQTAPMGAGLTGHPALQVRVTDANGVGSAPAPSEEPSLVLRSGRLQMESRVGSSARSLALPLRLEYWSGSSWVLSADDSCTTVAASAVVPSGRQGLKGEPVSWTNTTAVGAFAGGLGTLTLGAPSGGGAGTVDVALNLGSTSTDRACLPTHPASTGAGLPWLRSRHGTLNGCSDASNPQGRWDSDPSARASFGSVTAESQKRLHERQVY